MSESVAEPISESLIRQYDVSGPRYTSYPTADRFVEAFTFRPWSNGGRVLRHWPCHCRCTFIFHSVSRFAITAPATRSLPNTMIVLPPTFGI